jgi:hypothetical protein
LVVRTTVRLLIVSLVAALVMAVVSLSLDAALPDGRVASLLQIAVAGGLGAGAVIVLARTLRIVEIQEVVGAVTGRLRRR